MTDDPFFGDDSFGAWLLQQSEFDEEKENNKKAKKSDIAHDDLEGKDFLDGNYSDESESDYDE
jgi:hypothetical protein